jgi:hypothetical protein
MLSRCGGRACCGEGGDVVEACRRLGSNPVTLFLKSTVVLPASRFCMCSLSLPSHLPFPPWVHRDRAGLQMLLFCFCFYRLFSHCYRNVSTIELVFLFCFREDSGFFLLLPSRSAATHTYPQRHARVHVRRIYHEGRKETTKKRKHKQANRFCFNNAA